MARVYVSCADEDIDLSARIKDWLRFQDYEPVILNDHLVSKQDGWTGWQRSLAQTLEFCDAVLLVLSPDWINSKWCFSEFTKAYSMGKTIFAVIEKPLREAFSEPGIPVFDLTRNREHGLAGLASVLRDALPQAGDVFDFDPKRPIYPGLKFFEEADHAIFFSRDDDVRRIIDRLNTRRRQGGARLIALLGASGTGISSLMRAGVLPRLRRDVQGWIILPVMRPLFKPVEEFSKSIAHVFGKPERWQDWHQLFMGHGFKDVSLEIAEQLRERFNQMSAHILITIDQAEELFSISDPYEASRFLDILGAVFDDDMPYTGLMALRPDFLSNFQTADQLSHVIEEVSPRLMPLSGLRDLITGPGQIANVKIQDALVEAIIHDAAQEGALPLVEYTLNYLYELSAPNHYLTLENYNDIGAEYAGNTPLGNIIAKTCEILLDAEHLTAQELSAAKDFLARALVWRDAENRSVGRPFPLNELDPKTRTLAKRFLNRGLLSKRDISDIMCVEYTHLSILRHWPRLEQWQDLAEPYYEDFSNHDSGADLKSDPYLQGRHDTDILDLTIEGAVVHPATASQAPSSFDALHSNEALPFASEEEERIIHPPSIYASSDMAYDFDKKEYVPSDSRNALVTSHRTSESFENGIDVKILENFKAERYQETIAGVAEFENIEKKRSVLAQSMWLLLVAGIGIFIGVNWSSLQKMISGESHISTIWQDLLGQSSQQKSPEAVIQKTEKSTEGAKIDKVSVVEPSKTEVSLLKETALSLLLEKSENQISSGKPILGMLLAFEALGHEKSGQEQKDKSAMLLSKSLASLQNAMIFEGHQGDIEDISFSRNGLYIATASSDHTVRVWDLTTKKALNIFSDHKGVVTTVLFNQDSKFLVSGSADKTVKIWDLKSGQLQLTLNGHTDAITGLAMNPAGDRIATASKDKTVRVWSSIDGSEDYSLKGHTAPVTSVDFSSNGKWLVTSSEDQTIRIWDALSGTPLSVLEGHSGAVRSVVFGQDSSFILSASDDQSVRLWQSETWKQSSLFSEHTDGVTNASLTYEGNYVISSSRDGKALLWDRASKKVYSDLKHIPGGLKKGIFSQDGNWIAVASHGKALYVLPAKMYSSRMMFEQHTDNVFTAEFNRDNTRIVTASRDNTARIWNVSTGQQEAVLTGHDDQLHHAVFSPDQTLVATASRDRSIRIWQAGTGQDLLTIKGHEGDVNRLAFSPDGKYLVSASNDKSLRVWDIKTGTQIKILQGHEDKVWGVAFSIDGRQVISGSQDATVKIWDFATGKVLHTLTGHKAPVLSVAVSPDGTTVASASSDRTVRFWDIETGKIQPQLLLHPDTVLSLGFSGNGQTVITGGYDKIARVWNVQSGDLLYELKGHEEQVFSSTLDASGGVALTTSVEGARLWRLFSSSAELSFYAKSLLPRCLAAHERLEMGLGQQAPLWCKEIDEARVFSGK